MPEPVAHSAPLDQWLRRLPPPRLQALGQRYAARALALGLAVTQAEGGERPIPPLLSPIVAEPGWLARQVERTARLTELVRRVTAGMLAGPEREEVLSALFPYERRAIEAAGLPERLGVVRADLFLDAQGARALELNATIPAMQGYSDIAARAFLEAVGAELGLGPERVEALIGLNGENAIAQLDALRANHRDLTGRELERVALVHRPQDAQLTELRYLARRWEQAGVRASVHEAGELAYRDGKVTFGGQPVDYVYRHIFARRIEEQSGLGQLLLEPHRFPISNRVAAPLEMKRTFAELSRCFAEPALAARHGVTAADLEALAGLVPWTRPLRAGATTGPAGEAIPDLLAEVAANPARYVVKRSWDYGGRAVFLGFEAELEVTRERAQAAFGEPLAWPALVRRAAEDERGGGFVVQARVVTAQVERLVVEKAGPRWAPFYEDFSVYACLGIAGPRWGGVCRASASAVVNILGGGGVAPVLAEPVARALESALAPSGG